MDKYVKYLAIPYQHKSSDCYGLVKLFYSKEFGVDLLDFEYSEDWWKDDKNLIEELYLRAGFYKCNSITFEFGNILLFNYKGKPRHLGISLADGTFLHTTFNGTARHSYNDPRWYNNLVCVFKLEEK